MRICSLVPAATEVLFALGLGEQVVGVTHECDWPAEVSSRPAITASLIDTDELSSAEIDGAVADAAGEGRALYAVDAQLWAELGVEVVVAQELCDVCAVSTDDARSIVSAQKVEAEVLDFSPSTLEGILESIRELGRRFGSEAPADELTGLMQARLDRVRGALADVATSPRVFVSEWLEPPYAAGHWVPDMVEAARGTDVAGTSGWPSHRMRWTDVAALGPEVVILAPCGFDLDRTISEVMPLELSAHLLGTPAREEGKIFAVDANAYFSRPGPRTIDGVELLAYLLHSDAYSDPGIPWSRVRL